jgi:hypothetical protein
MLHTENNFNISYPVITSEEAKARQSNLFPDGEYKFSIEGFVNGFSKSSDELMVTVNFYIYKNDNNGYCMLKDYFLPTSETMLHRFRLLCDCVGLNKEYEAGNMDLRLLLNKTGFVKIGTKIDKTGKYEPKNVIKKFILEKNEQKTNVQNKENKKEFNDDIPF